MQDSATTNLQSLVRLSDADYEVAPGEPDIRGWDVTLGGEARIGRVDDLLIDPLAGKVRYLDVELDRKAVGLETDRHVLVPIASVQLDTHEKDVMLSGFSQAMLLDLPEHDDIRVTGDVKGRR